MTSSAEPRADRPSGRTRSTRSGRSRADLGPAYQPFLRGAGLYLAVALVAGGLSGLVWARLTRLPSYSVGSHGAATISEGGLATVFSADAVYCIVGAVLGLGLGVLAWAWFSRRGAWVVALAAAGPLLAALTCWWVGLLVGPSSFATRIAAAKAGDTVQIDLALHTWTPLLIWVLAAMLPVLVMSLVRWDSPSRSR